MSDRIERRAIEQLINRAATDGEIRRLPPLCNLPDAGRLELRIRADAGSRAGLRALVNASKNPSTFVEVDLPVGGSLVPCVVVSFVDDDDEVRIELRVFGPPK